MTSEAITRTTARTGTRQSIRTWTMIALGAFLASLLLWIGFLTVGGIFFTLSDGIALVLAASMIPVMVGFDALLRPDVGGLSRLAKWVGTTGMSVAAAGSVVLLIGEPAHEFVPMGGGLGMQFAGFALEGAWFVMLGVMSSRTHLLSRRLGTAAWVAGIGFLLGGLGGPMGPESITVSIGGVLSLVGFVWWAVRTRRELAE